MWGGCRKFSFCSTIFYMCLIYDGGRWVWGERIERESSICWLISPDACNKQHWTKAKLGVQNSMHVSKGNGRDQSTWTIAFCFLRSTWAGSWMEPGLAPRTVLWDAGLPHSVLTISPNAHTEKPFFASGPEVSWKHIVQLREMDYSTAVPSQLLSYGTPCSH